MLGALNLFDGSSYERISLFWWILNGIKFSLF